MKVQYATDLEKIAVDERRAEGNYERDKSSLWRLLYQNHLALQESLLFNPEKLTLFGRSVVATPPSTPRKLNACSQCARKTRKNNAKDLGLITLVCNIFLPILRKLNAKYIFIKDINAAMFLKISTNIIGKLRKTENSSRYFFFNQGNIRDKNAKENTKDELHFHNKRWMEKLKEILDCMPGSDGGLPLKEIQKRAEEEKEREAILAAMRKKYRKSLTRSCSGPMLPKIVVKDEEDTDSYQSGTFFR